MNWKAVTTAVQCYQQSVGLLCNLATGAPLVDQRVIRAAAGAAAAVQWLPDAGLELLGTYAHEAGWPPLLAAFRDRLSKEWCRTVAEEEVAVIPGVSATLHYLHEALRARSPGVPGLARGPYRLLFPAGGLEWFGLADKRNPLPRASGPYLTEDWGATGFRVLLPDPSLLDWEGVGAVCLSHPHCPTGRVWSEEELRGLAEAAAEQGAWLVLDEAEALPWAPLSETAPALVDHPQLLHLFSFSKIGLAGLRIGLAAGAPAHMAALRALVHDASIKVSTLDQFVATAALQVLEQAPPTSWFGARYAERWSMVSTAFHAAGALDGSRQLAAWQGGPYAWYTWADGASSTEVFHRLLDAGLAVCPASAMQMAGAAPINGIRIGLGSMQALTDFERAIDQLAPVLATATLQSSEQGRILPTHRQAAIKRVLTGVGA